MSDLNSDSPVSDIHICGRCRVEFHDIYKFINHKKHCGTKKSQAQPKPSVDQDGSSFMGHDVEDSSAHHFPHHDNSTFQLEIQSANSLPFTKPITDIESQQYHNEQHSYNQDRSSSYVQPSDQQKNAASSLCYKAVATQQEINSFAQHNSSVDSNIAGKQDRTRKEHGFEVRAINQQTSLQNSEKSENSTLLPVTATATSQELLNSAAGVGICLVSDNTVDSSALCPEDLEVGQISEAMMGKLSQKFYSKGPGLANRKLNENSNKRVGRLDPISTFTLRRKCDRNSTNVSKDLVGSLPFSANRMNSSSAPLVADCEDNDSPVDRLDLKGISFEKRERLQGVSDDLLNQSPSSSTTMQPGHGVTSIRFQNVIENSPSQHHETYSTENISQKNSIYKAVFTSPSCGGHRLAVKIPEEGNNSAKQTQHLSHTQRGENDDLNRVSLETKNCSTNYKDISKLAEMSGNENATPFEFERSESLVSNSNVCNLSDQESTCVKMKVDGAGYGKTQQYEEVIKEYSANLQQMNYPASKISEQIYPSISEDIQKEGTSANSSETLVSRIQNIKNSNEIATLSEMKANSVKNSVPLSTAEYTSWEPEEIQVIASADQMNFLQLSRTGDENKDIELSFKNENYSVDGDDTIVFVYKRDDGSLIMMCKPNGTNCDESTQESSLQAVAESVLSDGTVLHSQPQDYQVHSVIQQPGELCLEYKNNDLDRQIISASDTCGQKIVNLESCDTFSSSNTDSTSMTHNAIFVQACADQLPVNKQREVSSTINVVKDNGMAAKRKPAPDKVKGSSSRAREKPLKEIAIKPTCVSVPGETLTSAMKYLVGDMKKSVRGSGSNKIFTCHFGDCSYSTKLGKDFQRHYRTHTGERPFACDKCDKTFNRSDKLKAHLRCHAGLKPYECKICKYATTESGSLKKHMRIHNDERPFQCQICPYASRNSSQLVVHLRTHTGDAPFHCSFCSAQFKIKSDLKRHLRIHTGEKPFACDKCDYRCSNKGNLNIHYKINHSLENEKPCPQCSFVTSSMKRLREHIKIHDEARIIKCSVCQYTCNSSTALRSHMMVHNTLRPYRCSFCPYSSKQSGNLKKHVQNVHNERQRQTGPASSTSSLSGSSNKHSNLSSVDKPQRNGSSLRRRNKGRESNTSSNNTDSNAAVKPDYHPRPARRPSSSRKIHVCPLCGSGFVRHDSLRCHLKQHNEKESNPESNGNENTPLSPQRIIATSSISESISASNSKTALPPPLPLTQAPPQPPQQQQLFTQPLPQHQPLPPAPDPPLHPLPPPIPTIPTTYRNKGLDSIVAAASQLYREQYMNGKEEDDEEYGGCVVGLSSNTTSIKSDSNANLNKESTQVGNTNSGESHCSSTSHNNCNAEGDHSFSNVDLVLDTAAMPQLYTPKSASAKRQRGSDEKQGRRQPLSKQPRTRGSYSSTSKGYCTDVDASGSSQMPWEHSSYTVSASGNTNTIHLPTTAAGNTSLSSLQLSSSSLLSFPTSSTKVSKSQSSQSKTSSSNPHLRQQHRNGHVSQTQMQSQTPQQCQGTMTYHQYGMVTSTNIDASSPQQQPISIQLLPQGTHIQHPSTSQMTNSQNSISHLPFPPHHHHQQQQQQQQLSGVHHAGTALQILVPAGTQMTQIIQPPPPSPLQQLPPLGTRTSQQQQQQVVAQPQIVFQVQEATAMPVPGQDVITIPTSMAPPPQGSQVVLGQCPTFGLVQNQVITAPADSTTMGGLYNVTEQRLVVEDTQSSDFRHQSSTIASQEGPSLLM